MRNKKLLAGLLVGIVIVCFCSIGSAEDFSLREFLEEWRGGIEFEKGIQMSPAPPGITRIYVLVNTDDAPIEILSFGKGYEVEPRDSFSGKVEYKNRTNRDIEALAIIMVCYDVFNDEQGFYRGVDVFPTPLKTGEEGSIYLAVAGESRIVKAATAFVSRVRFLDGEVWEADLWEVLEGGAQLGFVDAIALSRIIWPR